MFTLALLVTAKSWKQPKRPPIKQIETFLSTMKYHSAIKRNKLLIHKTTWMDLNKIVLSLKKKPILKDYILYDSTFITFLKDQIILMGFY